MNFLKPHQINNISFEHFFAIIFAGIIAYLIYIASKKIPPKKFAIYMFIYFIIQYLILLLQFDFSRPNVSIYTVLPLSLCELTFVASIIAIYFNKPHIYKYTFFFSFGAAFALISPTMDGLESFTSLRSLRFNLTHILIITLQIYMYKQLGFRVFKGDGYKVYKFLIMCAPVIMIINFILGSNYFYLNEKLTDNFLIRYLGPWPVYIIAFALIAFVLVLIIENTFLKNKHK